MPSVMTRGRRVQPGRAVAFSIDDEHLRSERAVLVCELRSGESLDASVCIAIERELRRRVVRELDLVLGDV